MTEEKSDYEKHLQRQKVRTDIEYALIEVLREYRDELGTWQIRAIAAECSWRIDRLLNAAPKQTRS